MLPVEVFEPMTQNNLLAFSLFASLYYYYLPFIPGTIRGPNRLFSRLGGSLVPTLRWPSMNILHCHYVERHQSLGLALLSAWHFCSAVSANETPPFNSMELSLCDNVRLADAGLLQCTFVESENQSLDNH
jgi:hypothetical protein